MSTCSAAGVLAGFGCGLLSVVLAAPPAMAQTGTAARIQAASQVAGSAQPQTAEAVRDEFVELLARFPTGVAHVFRLDPSLLGNDVYIAPYPGLSEFLKQHPEVARNPEYFLQGVQPFVVRSTGGRSTAQAMYMDVMAGLFVLALLGAGAASAGWTIRTFIDYRRWNRLSKLQADAHAKLLDRFTQNDELTAYISSPAGTHFLQSMPIMLDPARKAIGAPLSKILWSVQAGVVLAATGVGLQYVSGNADEDAVNMIYSTGVVITAVGVGFIVAAIASYVLSRRFGLFDSPSLGRPAGGPQG